MNNLRTLILARRTCQVYSNQNASFARRVISPRVVNVEPGKESSESFVSKKEHEIKLEHLNQQIVKKIYDDGFYVDQSESIIESQFFCTKIRVV